MSILKQGGSLQVVPSLKGFLLVIEHETGEIALIASLAIRNWVSACVQHPMVFNLHVPGVFNMYVPESAQCSKGWHL